MTRRLLRLPEVIKACGLSKSTIYLRVAEKTFPAPVPLGGSSVAWVESEVDQWIESRIKARDDLQACPA